MSLAQITELVAADFEAVNQIIKDNIRSEVGLISELSEHIIGNAGKRLRPLIVLLSAKACNIGQSEQIHLLSAAAIEYFHTATLLHDDVLDDSVIRRGKDTANTIWGSKASILVGDILLTQAVQFMIQANRMPLLKVLIDAAFQITCGEIKQLALSKSHQTAPKDYFEVIKAKTALLFAASGEIGAMSATDNPALCDAMRGYGLHLGNAFQIVDDILDYTGTEETIGKQPGDDLRNGKVTLPIIYALKQGTPPQQQQLQQALEMPREACLDSILATLNATNAIQLSYQTAREQIDIALTYLQHLPDNQYTEALRTLALFSIERLH